MLAALAVGRAKARPYMLKRAPTLGVVKMERQGVVRDALPVVVLVFCGFYCCG
jgi:hypothetical protein